MLFRNCFKQLEKLPLNKTATTERRQTLASSQHMVCIDDYATTVTITWNRGTMCQPDENRSTEDGIRTEQASNSMISICSPSSNAKISDYDDTTKLSDPTRHLPSIAIIRSLGKSSLSHIPGPLRHILEALSIAKLRPDRSKQVQDFSRSLFS